MNNYIHTVELIANAIKDEWIELPAKTKIEVCAVTGKETLCVPRKKSFSSVFTTQNLLAYPSSEWVSVEAFQALKYKSERKSSWIVAPSKFRRLTRAEVREEVLNKKNNDIWAGYATTSYKKHGALIAPINKGDSAVWLFEMKLVDCSDKELINSWFEIMVEALKSGIGRTIIESLVCPAFVIKKVGVEKWQTFEEWAKPKYKSALYQFLAYLLYSQQELKEIQDEAV